MGPNGPDDRFSQPRYSLLASRWVRLAWPEIAARSTVVPPRVVSAVNLELRARRRRLVAARVAIAGRWPRLPRGSSAGRGWSTDSLSGPAAD